MTNAFTSAEAWEPQLEQILGPGNHLVTIIEAEDDTSSGGHPQINLLFRNPQGQIRDWRTVTDASVGAVVALAQSAHIDLPTDEDIVEGLRLKQSYLDQLIGKSIGIVVREEPSWKDPTKMRSVVQGYVSAERLKDSDATPVGAADAFAHATPNANANANAKDLPF